MANHPASYSGRSPAIHVPADRPDVTSVSPQSVQTGKVAYQGRSQALYVDANSPSMALNHFFGPLGRSGYKGMSSAIHVHGPRVELPTPDPVFPAGCNKCQDVFDNFNRTEAVDAGIASCGIPWTTSHTVGYGGSTPSTAHVDGNCLVTELEPDASTGLIATAPYGTATDNRYSMRFKITSIVDYCYVQFWDAGSGAGCTVQFVVGFPAVLILTNPYVSIDLPEVVEGEWYVIELVWSKSNSFIQARLWVDGDTVPDWQISQPLDMAGYDGGVQPWIWFGNWFEPAIFAVDWIQVGCHDDTSSPTQDIYDTFTRSVSSGWGTADCSLTWAQTMYGGANTPTIGVDGSRGVITLPNSGTTSNSYVREALTTSEPAWTSETIASVQFTMDGLGDPALDFAEELILVFTAANLYMVQPAIMIFPSASTLYYQYSDPAHLAYTQITWLPSNAGSGVPIPTSFFVGSKVFTFSIYVEGGMTYAQISDGETSYRIGWGQVPTTVAYFVALTAYHGLVRPYESSVPWVIHFDNLNFSMGGTCNQIPITGIGSGNAGYLPTLRYQIGDPTTTLDSYICGLESAAMALDWQTRGAVQVWGGELIPWCGRSAAEIQGLSGPDEGTTLNNLAQAWSHWNQYLEIRSGESWNDLLACLNQGRAVILDGLYSAFSPAEKAQQNYNGGHAIIVLPYTDGTNWVVGDPLRRSYIGIKSTSLQAYAEVFGAAAIGSSSPQRILFAVTRPWAN